MRASNGYPTSDEIYSIPILCNLRSWVEARQIRVAGFRSRRALQVGIVLEFGNVLLRQAQFIDANGIETVEKLVHICLLGIFLDKIAPIQQMANHDALCCKMRGRMTQHKQRMKIGRRKICYGLVVAIFYCDLFHQLGSELLESLLDDAI